MNGTAAPLRTTPLDALHRAHGARLVPFAGYAMPVQYPSGIIAEHTHCRTKAALFDVSHMGQARLRGADAVDVLERLVPGSIREVKPGRMRYTMLLNAAGGILDDLMVTREDGNTVFLVVNAACKDADFAHIRAHLSGDARLDVLDDRALIALQGPRAAEVLARLAPESGEMVFMSMRPLEIAGASCLVTRSGYTGEDGFEISVPAERAETLAATLLDAPEVAPAGLGARDSLRLEAGLCLYGNDIDTTTTPVEADLAWAIGKRRRQEGGFPGADVVLRQLAEGPPCLRVGLRPEGRRPVRAHTAVLDETGRRIGEVTSGGFGPTIGGPVAMGYVETALAVPGARVRLEGRGGVVEAQVVELPFVTHRYYRGTP